MEELYLLTSIGYVSSKEDGFVLDIETPNQEICHYLVKKLTSVGFKFERTYAKRNLLNYRYISEPDRRIDEAIIKGVKGWSECITARSYAILYLLDGVKIRQTKYAIYATYIPKEARELLIEKSPEFFTKKIVTMSSGPLHKRKTLLYFPREQLYQFKAKLEDFLYEMRED